MRSLWLAWLPLLFLPNLGFGGPTGFGTLELSDFLIAPFLVLVALAGRRRGPVAICRLTPLLVGFAGWALLSTLLVRERYGYPDHLAVITGVLKLGKLVLYGAAGVLAARALSDEGQRGRFPWALLAAGLVVAVALLQLRDPTEALRPGQVPAGYKAANAVSVMMAVLLCYLGGLWACGLGTPRWRGLAGPGLVVMVLGFLLSRGRGGWVAALAGAAYLVYRQGLGPRLLVALAGGAAVIRAAYGMLPDFRTEVDRTIWPDPDALRWNQSGVGGFDDGARLSTWAHELAAFARSPLLGTGFFHRGGSSGLWATGSHNFFLQMFLETGLVGGLLVLGAFWRMWRHAGSAPARALGQDAPVRSALVAALVGGLTGEYFYGGMVLFTLLLTFAPVGSLGGQVGPAEPGPLSFDDPIVPNGQES
ncbi:MAG: O-antigen ligase family protein [Isosphaeraceae bacterium]|nr:O-antigen ligase family protein [Isosphaeraceae bacterium]